MNYTIVESGRNLPVGLQGFLQEARGCDVIYLGEIHQMPQVLSFQIDVLSGLVNMGAEPSLGLEMLNVLQQQALDLYIAGGLPRDKFLEIYETSPEGFDLRHYMDLIDVAAGYRLKVVALNIPRDVASTVALKGLDRAELEGFRLDEGQIRDSSARYREALSRVYRKHPHERISEDNFILAQAIKDEMMAETIAYCLLNGLAGAPFVAVTGRGHMEYGLGMPERVRKKMKAAGRAACDITVAASYPGERTDPAAAQYILLI
jgi:uncharacterized iron-regulated protein